VSDADKRLSESVSVRVTVGEVWADRLKPAAKNNKLKSKKDWYPKKDILSVFNLKLLKCIK
jgi:hypothetical protein